MDRVKIARELVRLARELSSGSVPRVLWHISNQKFRKFDRRMMAQGILWFSKDRDDLVKNLHGASIRTSVPVYLYKCTTTAKNPAGWDEYDRYMLDQLRDMGYDSIDLGDDFVVFDPAKVKIVDVTVVE